MLRIIINAIFAIIVGVAISAMTVLSIGSSLDNAIADVLEDAIDDGEVIAMEALGDTYTYQHTYTLKAVGDMMFARGIETVMEENGWSYPLEQVSSYLSSADYTIGNLDSTLATSGTALLGKPVTLRAEPDAVVNLISSGFDMISLANNNSVDYDSDALVDTITLLEENDINTTGAGSNITEAREIDIVEINGVKTAYISFTEQSDLFWSYSYIRSFKATTSLAGVAPLYEDTVLKDIASAEAAGADVIVVNLHWGSEYSSTPASYAQAYAYAFIDAGADIIIGHNSHIIQGIEVYNGGLICYSLGNFIYDQATSDSTSRGLVLETEITPLGWRDVAFQPVVIEDGQTRLATDEEVEEIFLSLAESSSEYGTEFAIVDGKIVLVEGQ